MNIEGIDCQRSVLASRITFQYTFCRHSSMARQFQLRFLGKEACIRQMNHVSEP